MRDKNPNTLERVSEETLRRMAVISGRIGEQFRAGKEVYIPVRNGYVTLTPTRNGEGRIRLHYYSHS